MLLRMQLMTMRHRDERKQGGRMPLSHLPQQVPKHFHSGGWQFERHIDLGRVSGAGVEASVGVAGEKKASTWFAQTTSALFFHELHRQVLLLVNCIVAFVFFVNCVVAFSFS